MRWQPTLSEVPLKDFSADYWTDEAPTGILYTCFHLLGFYSLSEYWINNSFHLPEQGHYCEVYWSWAEMTPAPQDLQKCLSWYGYISIPLVPMPTFQMRKIRKRHSAELEHQSGNLLSTPQVLRLGCFIKKCMQFLYGHCLFLPDIHTGIYITKQSGIKRAIPASTPRL